LKELYTNNERNSEVTVLVTDYNMPNINGIDLCRELRAFPMKKILLTGAADHKQAVAAFNEGLIDCFIEKDSQTLIQDILSHITRLKQQYFIDRSRQLLNHLETDYPLPLSDPVFIDFFQEWCKKNEIQEYYLIDKYGNFLLVDNKGKKSYFIVHTDRTLSNFIESHQDDNEVTAFIREVELRKIIPFFGEGIESWELQPDKWSECFYTSQVLEGQQKYYWTAVKGNI
jgi:YesN/AraC family two-component response regulator